MINKITHQNLLIEANKNDLRESSQKIIMVERVFLLKWCLKKINDAT